MAVKIRFRKGAWWVSIHYRGRRKSKRIGDTETAQRVAQGIREKIARGDLDLTPSTETQTVKQYATAWVSRLLRIELWLWRRRERAAWLKKGAPLPAWVFASVSGTRLDPSNVRKAFARILAAADVHLRGLHQMRHTCASLLLQQGAPITYVARQLGHHDASMTLRIYAHWLPDGSGAKAVDLLDGAHADATPAQPGRREPEWRSAVSAYGAVVSREGIEPSTRRLRVCCSAN
jgi:integrase